MGDRAIKRHVIRQALTAGATHTIELPRDFLIESILLDLNGTAVTADLVTGDIRDNAPADLISKVEITKGGSDVIYSKNLAGVLADSRAVSGYRVLSAVATSTVLLTFRAAALLPLGRPLSKKYTEEYFVDPRRETSLTLSVTVATPAQGTVFFVSGEPTTYTSMSANLDVTLIGYAPGVTLQAGVFCICQRPEIKIPVTAANTALQEHFKVQGLIAGFIVQGMSGASAACLYRAATVVNSVSVKQGASTLVASVKGTSLNALAAIENNMQTEPTGLYVLDFSPDNMRGQMPDASVTDITLEFDAAAPGTVNEIWVWPIYVYAPVIKSSPK